MPKISPARRCRLIIHRARGVPRPAVKSTQTFSISIIFTSEIGDGHRCDQGCRGHPFRFSGRHINILFVDAISRRFHRLDEISLANGFIGIFTAYRNDIFQVLIQCSCLIALEKDRGPAAAKFPLTSAPVTPSSVRGSCAASSGLKTSPFWLLWRYLVQGFWSGSILSLIVISPAIAGKARSRARRS